MSAPTPLLPAACARARDAIGIALIDDVAPDAATQAHVATCADCTRVAAGMRAAWDGAAEIVPALAGATPPARLDAILESAIRDGRGASTPVFLPLRARPSREGLGFAAGLALAASLAAFAILHGPPRGATNLVPATETPLAIATATPPLEVPVRLMSAKGDVSLVPSDGSVIEAPKPGDALKPGLFAATGGAALKVQNVGLVAVRGDATILIGGADGDPQLSVARGEIFVDVPHGSIRTFVVHTPTGAVHVTGTQFDVKAGPKGTTVRVTRGSVHVTGAGTQAIDVKDGESGTLVRDGSPMKALVDTHEDSYAWVRDLAPDRAPPPPATPVVASATPALPPLDGEVAIAALQRRHDAMRYCYEQALLGEPDLKIDVEISLVVDPHGNATDIHVGGLPPGHHELAGCLADAASKAVFTAPGQSVQVNWHVPFGPKADEPRPPATP